MGSFRITVVSEWFELNSQCQIIKLNGSFFFLTWIIRRVKSKDQGSSFGLGKIIIKLSGPFFFQSKKLFCLQHSHFVSKRNLAIGRYPVSKNTLLNSYIPKTAKWALIECSLQVTPKLVRKIKTHLKCYWKLSEV